MKTDLEVDDGTVEQVEEKIEVEVEVDDLEDPMASQDDMGMGMGGTQEDLEEFFNSETGMMEVRAVPRQKEKMKRVEFVVKDKLVDEVVEKDVVKKVKQIVIENGIRKEREVEKTVKEVVMVKRKLKLTDDNGIVKEVETDQMTPKKTGRKVTVAVKKTLPQLGALDRRLAEINAA